jgi:hypothetical protein
MESDNDKNKLLHKNITLDKKERIKIASMER